MLQPFAKAFGGLSAKIINLGIQSPRGFRQVAPEFIGCIAALTMFDGGPAINRVHLAFDETFQRVQPLLRVRPDFAHFSGQMLFQTLKTLIVIAHLRSEKNLAIAINLSASANHPIRPYAYPLSYWFFN